MRELVRTVLVRLGYRVLVAADGLEAVELASREQLDLLLTDVIMPGLSGPETATKVRELQPKVRILFMSGYTAGAIDRHSLLEQDAALLQKPFTPGLLASTVRMALVGATSGKVVAAAAEPEDVVAHALQTRSEFGAGQWPRDGSKPIPPAPSDSADAASGALTARTARPCTPTRTLSLRTCASNDILLPVLGEVTVSSDIDRQRYAAIGRALADPKRLCVLESLASGEQSVGELSATVGCQIPNMSQHLAVLRSAGLVMARREGSTVFYRLTDQRVLEAYHLIQTLAR